MRDILQYPIPNRNCVAGEVLQEDIITLMQLFLTEIVRHLFSVKFLNAESALGTIIHKYTECIFLIKGNQMFMERHIGLVKFWYSILVDIVSSMDNKDFD